MIKIDTIKVSISKSEHITNTYLVYDESKEAILIDPGDEPKKVLDSILKAGVSVKYIVITHAHADHFGALKEVALPLNTKVLVHENDYLALKGDEENYSDTLDVKAQDLSNIDIEVIKGGQNIKIGDLEFEVIHTPGHTSGCICLYEKTSNVLFTGDTIFCNCYGRCDLESASFEDMVNSIKMLFNRFSNINIYPGHDAVVNIDSAKRRIRMLLEFKGVSI